MKKTCFAVISVIALSEPAIADHEVTASQVAAMNTHVPVTYISGVIDGMEAAMSAKGNKRLYCKPADTGLSHKQYKEMIDDLVKREPSTGILPAGLAMMIAMRERFPCPD